MGKNIVQAKQWIDECYPDSAPSKQMVEKWFADSKPGCTNTDVTKPSGRPNSAVVPQNIKKSTKWFLLIMN